MKQSAGILLFRKLGQETEVLLVHPGGPFFVKKNEGWWTVPKGEPLPGEAPLNAAIREFKEETGYQLTGNALPLQSITQKGGKQVLCWAMAGDLDASTIQSNTFEIQWPPNSGKVKVFPEIDQARWFTLSEAKTMINARQIAFLDELAVLVKSSNGFSTSKV